MSLREKLREYTEWLAVLGMLIVVVIEAVRLENAIDKVYDRVGGVDTRAESANTALTRLDVKVDGIQSSVYELRRDVRDQSRAAASFPAPPNQTRK